MRNNLWNKDRRKDGLWFNQIGGGGIATGFSTGTGGGTSTNSGYTTGSGTSGTTTSNFTSNVSTIPNLNPNNLTAGSVAGNADIGQCDCSYNMNCWSQTSPSTLSVYPGQNTATCPSGTQLSEPTPSSQTTYSGTCYNTGCTGNLNGQSYSNLALPACPTGTQLTQPTCNMNNCYTGGCGSNGLALVDPNGPYYNGNCPSGTSASQPICGSTGGGGYSGGGVSTGGGGSAGFSS